MGAVEESPGDVTIRKLDSRALQGLAHPLRVRLFEELTYGGPSTATQLAERLGESSGATSYHLRQLHKAGFVEEDTGRGAGRERWWRRVPGGIQWGGADDFADDTAARVASDLLESELTVLAAQRRAAALADSANWPRPWLDAQMRRRAHLVLTVDEARQLVAELGALVDRWKQRYGGRDNVPAAERHPDLADVDLEVMLLPLLSAAVKGVQPVSDDEPTQPS